MKIYAVIEVNPLKLLHVTDDLEDARAEIKRVQCGNIDREGRYKILETESLNLSPSAVTCVSMEREFASLEGVIRTRLIERGLSDALPDFEEAQILPDIASEAYYHMACRNTSEADAVDAAINQYLESMVFQTTPKAG